VPLSFNTTLSASATVVDVADVSPSNLFNSVAVDVTPSNIFNSAAVEVIAVLPKVSPPSGTTILLPDCAVKVFAVN
jgi:hypothetical protein